MLLLSLIIFLAAGQCLEAASEQDAFVDLTWKHLLTGPDSTQISPQSDQRSVQQVDDRYDALATAASQPDGNRFIISNVDGELQLTKATTLSNKRLRPAKKDKVQDQLAENNQNYNRKSRMYLKNSPKSGNRSNNNNNNHQKSSKGNHNSGRLQESRRRASKPLVASRSVKSSQEIDDLDDNDADEDEDEPKADRRSDSADEADDDNDDDDDLPAKSSRIGEPARSEPARRAAHRKSPAKVQQKSRPVVDDILSDDNTDDSDVDSTNLARITVDKNGVANQELSEASTAVKHMRDSSADLQTAAGHHHGHGHGHYYQYAEVPKKKTWKFGFKRGNHKHEIERHEKGHKNKFHSSFKWHAKEKCKKKGKKKCKSVGKMTWEYKHHDKKKKHHG